jgi:hypothetical protein
MGIYRWENLPFQFTQRHQNGRSLKKNENLFSICLKQFEESLSACCAIGLKLISMHQSFKFQTIVELMKSKKKYISQIPKLQRKKFQSGMFHPVHFGPQVLIKGAKTTSVIAPLTDLSGTKHCIKELLKLFRF